MPATPSSAHALDTSSKRHTGSRGTQHVPARAANRRGCVFSAAPTHGAPRPRCRAAAAVRFFANDALSAFRRGFSDASQTPPRALPDATGPAVSSRCRARQLTSPRFLQSPPSPRPPSTPRSPDRERVVRGGGDERLGQRGERRDVAQVMSLKIDEVLFRGKSDFRT